MGDGGRKLAIVHDEHLQVALVAHQELIKTIREHVTGLTSVNERDHREVRTDRI